MCVVLTSIELAKAAKPMAPVTIALFIVSQLLIFSAVGCFLAWRHWRRLEKYYQKIRDLETAQKA